MSKPESGSVAVPARSQVVAWAMWDCGVTGLSAITATFVFSVYLTHNVGADASLGATPLSWLERTVAAAGVVIAILAPVVGVWVESPHRRRTALVVLTSLAVVLTCSMALIRDEPGYFFVGLTLLAATAACGDLASIPYNAMLRQLSTPETAGRISGFGQAAGYIGSVALLVVVLVGFVSGSGDHRGVLHLPVAGGINVRAAMLLAAAWMACMALPLLLVAHRLPDAGPADAAATPLLGSYRKLWSDITSEWRRDRNLVYFLVAAALFRDGLAAMFGVGAVLGVGVYHLTEGGVLVFGVAALVVAGLGAVVGGFVDHRIGSKRVIVVSLIAIIAAGLAMLALSGPSAFWVCGLLLCLFIGPVQASARVLLLRMAPHGKEGVAFGLYTMTGRAMSFLAPWLFSVFVDVFHADRAGLVGICLVLLAGLSVMLGVRVPAWSAGRPGSERSVADG
ncbi:MFS transporter [Mycobacterium sp.]|uniref:MFS transporter n=1 Tax=Mycobacterium sp. TaxID=1785 RepID=UPI003A8B005B